MKRYFNDTVMNDPAGAAAALAKDLADYLRDASAQGRKINIALSGGSTPQLLFSIIAGEYGTLTDWSNVHFFWVDERCVVPSDKESNYGNAQRMLLGKINIPSGNIHRIHGEADPDNEALRYAAEINASLPSFNGYPRFDIVLLGMGDDGHTASIFPGQEALFSSPDTCVVSIHPATGQKRITLTGVVINNAGEVIFLVTGSNKKKVMSIVRDSGPDADRLPAAHIKPLSGNLSWYTDQQL